jgi:hypothetical protein
MGRLRSCNSAWAGVAISLFVFLPACGGHRPAGISSAPASITLNPGPSFSLQLGSVVQFSATARNSANQAVNAAFTYTSSNPGVVDIAPNGAACGGTWNAPFYSICTPGGLGTANGEAVQIIATANGGSSPPTYVFVHPFISSIKITIVPPVNSPPPACPTQTALPLACDLPFKPSPNNSCLSQNQIVTLQATAYDSQGNDITASVGPFAWSQGSGSVAAVTPIVTVTYYNVPTNQATVAAATPGQTEVIASASSVFSEPFVFETCPVQCIALTLNVSGSQQSNQTTFVVTKGTSQTVTATAVDVQGCIVPKAPLTWISSEPAALAAGGGTTGCAPGTATCSISTTQPGVSAITATCTPPTCNAGFPLNLSGAAAPYIPQPVYPVTAISGLVTGAASSTSVLATSQDCYSDIQCAVAIYNVSTVTNLPGASNELPTPPNSLLFDPLGDRAYMGSEFGAFAINPANFGSSNPYSSLPASGTELGLVTGKVLAVSHTGAAAIFSDTVSTPNQVYVVGSGLANSTIPLDINSAIAATFSPDGLKGFILGDGGNTLYIYSAPQALQTIPLATPATSIVFNSSGTFALLSGGGAPGTLAAYNTCDNSPVTLSSGALTGPPLFLKMVPVVDIPQGNPLGNTFGGILIPNLQTTGLDFFFGLDSTGIDIIATNASQPPLTELCHQPVTLAQTTANTPFPPVHINIGQGTLQPINFFLSPDATRAYIVTNDSSQVLIYDFNTNSTSAIPLVNNATPISADMTVDGTMIYVAGSDGLLHQVSIPLSLDQTDISFTPLANSSNNFCYTGTNCALNMVAIKP